MAKPLQEHLTSGDGIGQLVAHADRLLRLQEALKTALPAAFHPYVQVANLRSGKACIHARNSAIANKIRQMGPRLADALSSPAVQVTEIEVRVQAGFQPSAIRQKSPKPPLPGENRRQALAALAASLPTESPLKVSLEQLLRTMEA
jgi:hypothetical protein